MTPYYESNGVSLYYGTAQEILPQLDLAEVSCVIADPPYAETSLSWDRWTKSWPSDVASVVPQSASMWCFGSFRMFLHRGSDFSEWKLAQDVVWEKHNGSGFARDRFRRVHEYALHWYRGAWGNVYKQPQFTYDATARSVRRRAQPAHTGRVGESSYESIDGGPRLMRSVLKVRSEHRRAIHPTQKPVDLVTPLVRYSARPGSVVLDLFSGSGTGLVVAKQNGFRAIGIEADLKWCDAIATRLAVVE